MDSPAANSIADFLSKWSNVDCVKFAVWCARKVVHLNGDPTVLKAIEATEKWMLDPSENNVKLMSCAAYAATRVADAADAAAATRVADADAADAADAAADAANAAAYATRAADTLGGLSDKDLLDMYIAEQLMEIVSG